jgi:hypothetical protein
MRQVWQAAARRTEVASLTAMATKRPHRSGNPANRAAAAQNPRSAGNQDGAFYATSRKLLVRLSALPPIFIPVAMMVLLLAGLLAPLVIGIPCLVIVLAFVSWLAVLSWPVLDTKGRLVRGLMCGLVFGALLGRITGTL